jgi:hypothetical protein
MQRWGTPGTSANLARSTLPRHIDRSGRQSTRLHYTLPCQHGCPSILICALPSSLHQLARLLQPYILHRCTHLTVFLNPLHQKTAIPMTSESVSNTREERIATVSSLVSRNHAQDGAVQVNGHIAGKIYDINMYASLPSPSYLIQL